PTDTNVKNGYATFWGQPYDNLRCQPPAPTDAQYQQPNFASYNTMPFQGAIGEFGLHFFFTADSDNVFTPLSVDEIDAEQWVYVVPTTAAENLISPTASAPGRDYGLNVQAPLQTAVTPFSAASLPAAVPETPLVALLPLAV